MREILIIEDHGVVRAGISHILEREPGLEVAGAAGNGQQALNLVRNGLRPDVVLCDLHLGDMSGIDLVRELQQLAPEAGVIMLTVEASEHYLSEAFQAGAKGYLLKEADSDDLIYAIKKVLQGKNFICTGLARRYKEQLLHSKHVAAPQPEIELSERESEVLHLLADGFTNIEVADRLFTSKRTVEGHRLSLLHKTGARNGLELIKLAMLQGLINIPERRLS
ncbi:two component transcriptional regulator, LuxR family [Mucilaginibacter pineti]|uniref:Two component transcriptional regulator, LuxR family n=1 Tax=Mucilaginibacter pineti TaxID=1391627 RepID=A0A1G7HA02_9SPHI|nr:response regulator transcription factor [Mucilaginibacter pineti]SDE97215.1 two component transcriptional regulator, LuxR family [Mucilaginibacter pineti]